MLLLLFLACSHPDPADTGDTGTDDTGGPAAPRFTPEHRWSANDDWEPTIAADPNGPWVYQSTTRIADIAETVLRVSEDGGETWGDDRTVSDGYDTYDPQVAVAADTGCVVFAYLGGVGGWSTFTRTSCDHGASWTDPVAIAPADWTTDHGWLLVSPSGQDVYVAFNGAPAAAGGAEEGEEQDGIGYVAVSHDGGASYTDVAVAGDGLTRYWFELGGAVAPDGTVYVANAEYSADYTGTANLVAWRSADGGVTWDTATVATSAAPATCAWADGCTFGFFAAQAAVAVDADGALLFVWSANDTAGGPMTLWAAGSPGGDAWDTFGAPVAVSAEIADNNFPTVKAGTTGGDFHVAWQGADVGSAWNTWYRRTADGGVTWQSDPVRLSAEAGGAAYKSEAGYTFPYGDYFGLAVDGQGVDHVIWGEGPSWTGPGGTWWSSGM
jgi:hypothetical protein